MKNNMTPMISCEEARKVLYDIETMHSDKTDSNRPSMVTLAKAHILVCMKCNSFFENEKAFIAILRDKITRFSFDDNQEVLSSTLHLIQDARIAENSIIPLKYGIIERLRRFFFK